MPGIVTETGSENLESAGARRPALDGIRVIDLSQIAAGPYASALLGDLGADVIKVEPPGGERFRNIDNLFGPKESGYYYAVNRSKRSIVLDLKTPAGHEVLERLIKTADVILFSMRPAAVERLSLTYDEVAQMNPQIIYCMITAFGETGPLSAEPGMDLIAQALSGVMGLTGEPDGPPVKAGPPLADYVVSFLSCFAIVAALRARDRDGVGQKLSLNLLDGQIGILANYITPYVKSQVPMRPVGSGHPQLVPYQGFLANDGYFILACLNDRFWPPICEAIGRPDLLADQRFTTNVLRVKNRKALIDDLSVLFATKSVAEWVTHLRSRGVAASPINRLEQALVEPQIVHNGMIKVMEHPKYGPYTIANTPFKMHGTPAGPTRVVTSVGENNDEVLAELGYSQEEVEALRRSGTI
jgi:succinate--hydroxymethylglutarate CoA-transferase